MENKRELINEKQRFTIPSGFWFDFSVIFRLHLNFENTCTNKKISIKQVCFQWKKWFFYVRANETNIRFGKKSIFFKFIWIKSNFNWKIFIFCIVKKKKKYFWFKEICFSYNVFPLFKLLFPHRFKKCLHWFEFSYLYFQLKVVFFSELRIISFK